MSEKFNVVKRREIKVKGMFDVNKVYKEARNKISDLGYDFTEKEQTVKDLARGKEILIKFLGERKFDELTKFHMSVDMMFENTVKVKKGEKNLDKGDVKIVMACWLEIDYRNRWSDSSFKKFLFHIYTKYLIMDRILSIYCDKLEGEFNEEHDVIKEGLNLYR